eukprot:gb/GEZN01000248.1/.p1 GENE.gb/GEZN01000248.1/~~gb/GEZN01000248.1/.p1  ORF type:complete len:589 (-),score=88.30 gb/GEZN01000248.1/:542-2308(-)
MLGDGKKRGAQGTKPGDPALKKQKLAAGRAYAGNGQPIALAPEHAVYYGGRPIWCQEVMTPAPSTAALNLTSFFSFYLENSSSGLITDATLQFKIKFTTTADAKPSDNAVLPVTQWFERIEWYDRNTGQELVRYHGDISHLLLNTLPSSTQEVVKDLINYDDKTGKYCYRQFAANEEVLFYWPLAHVWFNGMDLDLGKLRGDLEIRFFPRAGIFITPQTTVTTPTTANLTELRIIYGSRREADGQRAHNNALRATKALQHNYIDFQQYIDYAQPINADTEFSVDLDQFHHDSACLIMMLKKSGVQPDTTTINPLDPRNLVTFSSIGDGGHIDHENVHGKSLMGEGTPMEERYMRSTVLPELFGQKYCEQNNVYIIPFSLNLPGVLNGEIDGFHPFRGARERLKIRTGTAAVDNKATYTVTGGATDIKDMTSNRIEFQYNGVSLLTINNNGSGTIVHEPASAYAVGTMTSNVSVYQGWINESSYLKSQGVQIKLSFDTGATLQTVLRSFYVAFTDLEGQPLKMSRTDAGKFTITVKNTAANPGDFHPMALTAFTTGKRGFQNGVYDIYLYSVYYRYVTEAAGRLDSAVI